MLCYYSLFKDLCEKEGEALGLPTAVSALSEDVERSPILPILRSYFASSACVKAQNKPLLSADLMTYFAASLAVSQLYHTAGCAPM